MTRVMREDSLVIIVATQPPSHNSCIVNYKDITDILYLNTIINGHIMHFH